MIRQRLYKTTLAAAPWLTAAVLYNLLVRLTPIRIPCLFRVFGKDTAEETNLPSEEVILSDLNFGVGVDEDGDYYNGWGVTDHYNADTILGLSLGKDFVEVLDTSIEKEGALL